MSKSNVSNFKYQINSERKEKRELDYKEKLIKTQQKIQPKSHLKNDYLDLIRCTYPYCNCGKCIQKKNRDYKTSPYYNYQRNIQSNYQNEFDWKEIKKIETFKKGKISHLDQGFKEHIKSGLESVNRKDYKSLGKNLKKLKIYTNQKEQNNKASNLRVPFFARSSYQTQYPNWNAFIDRRGNIDKVTKDEVPFYGKSSYSETYGNIENKYYKEKTSPILKKDCIQLRKGEFICSTSSGQTYKPIDYKMARYLNNFSTKSSNSPNLWSPPNSKDCFMSTYENAFKGNDFN